MPTRPMERSGEPFSRPPGEPSTGATILHMLPFSEKLRFAFKSGGIRGVGIRALGFLENRLIVLFYRLLPRSVFANARDRAIIRVLAKQSGDPDSLEMLGEFVLHMNRLQLSRRLRMSVPLYFVRVFNLVSPICGNGNITIAPIDPAVSTADIALFNKAMLNQVPPDYARWLQDLDIVFENGTYLLFANPHVWPSGAEQTIDKQPILASIAQNKNETTESIVRFDGFNFIVRDATMDQAIVQEVKSEYIEQLVSDGFNGKNVIDLGAHIGSFSIQVSRLVSADAKIVCVEPSPRNYSLLRRNIALNRLESLVLPKHAAVSSKRGWATLFISSDNTGGSKLDMEEPSATETVDVRALKLDDIVDEFGTQMIDLLKIDVEGSEQSILFPNKHLLKDRVAAIIGEAGKSVGGDGLDVVGFLESCGFRVTYTGNASQLIFYARAC